MTDDGYLPTAQLRFVWKINRPNRWGEVLQQLWIEEKDTHGVKQEQWRDVPLEEE